LFDLKNIQKAFALKTSGVTPPAVLCCVLPDNGDDRTVKEGSGILPECENAFEKLALFFNDSVTAISVEPVTIPGALWEIEAITSFNGEQRTYILWSGSLAENWQNSFVMKSVLSDELKLINGDCRYIGVASVVAENFPREDVACETTDLSENSSDPYDAIKNMYRLLYQIEPQITALIDLNTRVLWGGERIKRFVFSDAPMGKSLLYSLSVKDSFLFTKGLSRLGISELVLPDSSDVLTVKPGCISLLNKTIDRLVNFGMPKRDEEAFFIGKGVSLLLSDDSFVTNGKLLYSSSREDGFWCNVSVHFDEFSSLLDYPVDENEMQYRRLAALEYFPDCVSFFKTLKSSKHKFWRVFILVGLADEGTVKKSRKFGWYEVKSFTDAGFLGRKVRTGNFEVTSVTTDESNDYSVDENKLYYFDKSFFIDWRLHKAGSNYSPFDAKSAL